MRNFITAVVATGALLGAASSASAATATNTFTVSATVLKTCSVSATNLVFGNYTPGAGSIATAGTTSTVTLNCSNGTTYTVGLNAGTTTGGTVAARLMAEQGGGTGTLGYNLCTAAIPAANNGTCSAGTAWGDGTLSTVTQAGTGAGMGVAHQQTLTVFGGLPDNAANQAAPVQASGTTAYQDTVTVTVTY